MVSHARLAASIAELQTLMTSLRDPQHGCAWDRKQTLQSLTRHTLEEVYEVIDAIELGDADKLCDELGDLLFQVVFYARIAEEQGDFDLADVAAAVTRKLLHRHPHIFPDGTLDSFGQPSALTAEDVERNWEQIKNAERAAEHGADTSVMDDIARALPAMERAHKIQKRAASVGFDWSEVADVMRCVERELDELREAMQSPDTAAHQHELGDVLFSCVNLARHLGLDAEQALQQANQRFETRFRYMEEDVQRAGLTISEQSLPELDSRWQQAKHATRK